MIAEPTHERAIAHAVRTGHAVFKPTGLLVVMRVEPPVWVGIADVWDVELVDLVACMACDAMVLAYRKQYRKAESR